MKKLIAMLIVIQLQACDFRTANRSGTLEDDYLEEPLSSRSIKYEQALKTSNQVMSLIRDGNCESIYQRFMSGKAKENVSFDSFESMCSALFSSFGGMTKYKPNQWHFYISNESDNEYLMSIKIAEHENAMVNYALVFPVDGDYGQIIGIHLKARQGVLPAGMF